jgi:biotin carboxylase
MPEGRTLLVLGASNYQCNVIRRAQWRGIRVVVVDWSAENPGHAIADESHVASTTDVSRVLRIARQSKIDGIIAPATDVAVETQAVVAAELGLFGPPPSAARLLTSKSAFFDYLKELGFAVPPFDTFAPHSLPDGFAQISSPCVVKPDDSSGSKGVTLVSDSADLAPAVAIALQHSRSGRALAQHYEAGFQGTVEGCLLKGEIVFSFVTRRHLPPLPVVATAGHTVPSGLSPQQTERILEDVRHLLTSLGIFDSVFDADFVWSGNGPKFLELTPRLGGNSLSQLVHYHCGVSIEDMAIDIALTGTASVIDRPPYAGTSKVVLLHSNEGGRLEYDPTRLAAALAVGGVKQVVLDLDPGTKVSPFSNGRHRFGEIIAQGPTPKDADAAIERARLALELRIV